MTRQTIGAFLATQRKALGYTQEEVAGNQVKVKGTRPERRLLRALRLILIAILGYCCFAAPIHRKMRSFEVACNRKRVDCRRCKAKPAANIETY